MKKPNNFAKKKIFRLVISLWPIQSYGIEGTYFCFFLANSSTSQSQTQLIFGLSIVERKYHFSKNMKIWIRPFQVQKWVIFSNFLFLYRFLLTFSGHRNHQNIRILQIFVLIFLWNTLLFWGVFKKCYRWRCWLLVLLLIKQKNKMNKIFENWRK